MVRTLHLYLSRELLKVGLLALVAFTLVMTVFAIVEPLRKEGLTTDRLSTFIAYTLPIMLSLTLPIAALFAATIVYGRFSQDNELMACRASGISTLTLLKPGLALGAVVTVLSLLLSSFVTPSLAKKAEVAVKANIRGIVYRQLQTKSYYKMGDYVVHADEAYEDKQNESLRLRGVVAAYTQRSKDIRVLVARRADVTFETDSGETYVTIDLIKPAATRTSDPSVVREESQRWRWGPLPNPAKEDPSWYDWNELVGTLREPSRNEQIRKELSKIRRKIGHDMLGERITRTIRAGKAYDELRGKAESYVITAPKAETNADGAVVLLSRVGADGVRQPVVVEVSRNGYAKQIFSAENGKVQAAPSIMGDASRVTISLRGDVLVRRIGDPRDDNPQTRREWHAGEIPMPSDIADRTAKISLTSICLSPVDEFTTNPAIQRKIRNLQTNKISRLTAKIVAEMHTRMAYGAGCFLMVAMGAALGLIFRGGQIVSAFAISVVPAAVVIVMILMGKEMVRHPKIATEWGLLAIWSGVVALVAANLLVHMRLLRR